MHLKKRSHQRRINSSDGGPYHIENSLSICKANQWTGFYMIETSVMKELRTLLNICKSTFW